MREFTKNMLVSDGVKGCRTTKRCEGVDRQTLARDGTRALLKFFGRIRVSPAGSVTPRL